MTDPSGTTIRVVTSDTDRERFATIVNATTPDDPTDLADIRWADTTYPGTTRLLAEVDGRAVGAASVGRIYVYPPEHPALWASIAVLPGSRRQGIGGMLLRRVSEVARASGKTGLHLRCMADRPEGIAFLAHRGFTELERSKTVALDLAGLPRPSVEAPAGFTFTTLAARPELVAGVHAVAVEAFGDIPGGDEPMAAGDLAEFRARDVDRPAIPKDAFVVAVETGTDRVAGYASLVLVPGSTTRAYHDMTAVLREFRGRGLARELKRATIAWAIDNGLTALETGNDEANAPMRAVNGRLGYLPLPDELIMRGPVDDAMMTP